MRPVALSRPLTVTAAVLVAFCAVVSGGTYPFSADIFIFTAALLSAVALAGAGPAELAAFWPAALPACVAFLSCAWTVNLNNTLAQAVLMGSYALFVLAVVGAARGGGGKRLLKAALLAAVAVSLYGIYQYYIGFKHTEAALGSGLVSADGLTVAVLKYRRAFSTLFSPNIMACYLATAFPVIMAFYAREKRWTYIPALAIVFWAVLLTKSVGGFVAFSAGIAVYAAAAWRGWGKGVAKPLLVFLLAVALAAAGLFILMQRSEGFFGAGKSVLERRMYWASAAEIWAGAPLTGRGAGSFELLYPGYKRPGADETRYAHNLPLQAMAETGIIGLAAVSFVFFIFFIKGARKRDDPALAGLMPGVLGGGAAFLASSLMDISYFVPDTAILFWLYFGLASSGGERAEMSGKAQTAIKAALFAAVLALVYVHFLDYEARDRRLEALSIIKSEKSVSERALSLAHDAVRLKPYDDSSHAFLAALYGLGAPKEPRLAALAEREYGEAIRLNPYYPFYYKDLALYYIRMGDRAKARKCFKMALKRYPSSQTFKNYTALTGN